MSDRSHTTSWSDLMCRQPLWVRRFGRVRPRAYCFASSQHVATVFKKRLGTTPTEWRLGRLG